MSGRPTPRGRGGARARGAAHALTLTCLALGCDPTSNEQPVRAATPGEATYNRYCVSCHGHDGSGSGGVTGANLAGSDSPLLTRSDEALMTSIREGKRGATATMPAHGPVLSDAQIAEVLRYVKARFRPSGASAGEARAAQP